jgi:hypothetical protein
MARIAGARCGNQALIRYIQRAEYVGLVSRTRSLPQSWQT